MAMFMPVRERKTYEIRRDFCISKCKELLRFENENVNFVTAEFLPEYNETRGGALPARKKWKSFYDLLGIQVFRAEFERLSVNCFFYLFFVFYLFFQLNQFYFIY
jgi:hypothetical protein